MAIVVAAVLLSIIVLVISHEFGHFLAAKKFGVKVLEFGFGLPPRLWGKKVGPTIFSLNLLPIGGFVRLMGEDETEEASRRDKESFANKTVGQRMGIVVAGVIMNLILSWLLFYAVLIQQDFRIFYPTLEPTVMVSQVEKGSPAEQAGVKSGDRIIAIDGQPLSGTENAVNIIKSKEGVPLRLTLSDLDKQQQHTVTVIPQKLGPEQVARIGVAFPPVPFKHYDTPLQKLVSAPSYSWDLTRLTFQGFGQLFTSLEKQDYQTASQSVAGPVGIVVIINEIVRSGALPLFLWFLGVMSLTLAIVNILPFPALDGGRAVFLMIEGAFGKGVKPEIEKWVHLAGMVFLLGLIILITYSDIQKFILR